MLINPLVRDQIMSTDIDADANNPPGFRFSPTEEELLGFYLKNKLEKRKEKAMEHVIPVVEIHRFDPWQLPALGGSHNNENSTQWYFFHPRQEREVHGGRPSRTTPSGYWKATGSLSLVYSSSNRESCRVMGAKKTMVFYKGRAPSGSKTKWKMNEYRALQQDVATLSSGTTPMLRNEFSLCRVYSGTLRSFDRHPIVTTEASSSTANPAPPQGTSSHDSSSSGNDPSDYHNEEIDGVTFDWNTLLDLLDWD